MPTSSASTSSRTRPASSRSLDPDGASSPGSTPSIGVGPYDAIDTGAIGTDAIRVGLIYRSDRVVPVGDFAILDSTVDPRFIDTRSRPVLAQTFEDLDTGARFTVAVNHLKSKGSACTTSATPTPATVRATAASSEPRPPRRSSTGWPAIRPGPATTDILILGDLNSYAKEDPIDAILEDADEDVDIVDDYTNLIAAYQGTYAHSYVFDGQGATSTTRWPVASLVGQVTGVAEWHINSRRADVLDYNTTSSPPARRSLYAPDRLPRVRPRPDRRRPRRRQRPPEVDAGGPYEVEEGGTTQLSATGIATRPGTSVTYAWDLDGDGVVRDRWPERHVRRPAPSRHRGP